MHTLPEAEARALLSIPTVCEDIGAWQASRAQPDTWTCGAGLVHQDGTRVGCIVELLKHQSRKTRIVRYALSVFKQSPSGLYRAYQLDVTKWPRMPADLHQGPHEHMGDLRINGDARWLAWGYDDALAHFAAQTNITFVPPVEDPEVFVLRG